MAIQWSEHYASRTKAMRSSAIRELLKLTQQPDIISFAGGLPAPELFPRERVSDASQRVLLERGCQALQYGTTEGYNPLREMIARQMADNGFDCTIDNILITAGSQQALDLIGKIFLDPGDMVIVEEPSYLGALQAWRAYEAEFVSDKMDEYGMIPASLEEVLQRGGVKFIYALPTFQNPTGRTMPVERRAEIVRLAAEYGVPIVEDNPYGDLYYEDKPLPPLIAVDAEQGAGGNVIYLGTFSKTLCPGFRVAWTVAPEEVIGKMVQAKQGADLNTGTFAQMVAYETATGGFLEEHVAMLRRVYRERRDLMLSLMDELFPPSVTWTRPGGGLFLWVTMPEGIDSAKLLERAVEKKVAFVPGSPFYANGGGENTLRINFSNASPEQIREGVTRLAAVFAEATAAQPVS